MQRVRSGALRPPVTRKLRVKKQAQVPTLFLFSAVKSSAQANSELIVPGHRLQCVLTVSHGLVSAFGSATACGPPAGRPRESDAFLTVIASLCGRNPR
jgi:hypothetical protein